MYVMSYRRGVKLSSVLGCLCAGVKVLYTERREEEGKRGEEGGKRKRKGRLVSLSSIHSKLWGHSEFPDILYSTSNSPPISEPKGNPPPHLANIVLSFFVKPIFLRAPCSVSVYINTLLLSSILVYVCVSVNQQLTSLYSSGRLICMS